MAVSRNDIAHILDRMTCPRAKVGLHSPSLQCIVYIFVSYYYRISYSSPSHRII